MKSLKNLQKVFTGSTSIIRMKNLQPTKSYDKETVMGQNDQVVGKKMKLHYGWIEKWE